jgi:hypothetical protein
MEVCVNGRCIVSEQHLKQRGMLRHLDIRKSTNHRQMS